MQKILIGGLLCLCGTALAMPNSFCGGAATPGDPSDLANVVGDQTLEYAIQQPASLVTCAKGYLLEKCGDHENALKLFDKCIAAGYAGAMIWKALLLEDGHGTAPDLAEAARLMRQAAASNDPGYAAIGKLHYATMLHHGRGVPRDPAEARHWFEAAAADGNEEAREFLRTGYHTGGRDQRGLGAGRPPETLPAATEASSRAPVQHLTPVAPPQLPTLPPESQGLGALLAIAFVAGLLRQRRRQRADRPGVPA